MNCIQINECCGLSAYFSNLVLPLKTLWTMRCFLSLPAVGWRGELRAQKVKNMGCDKNSLLETAVK